ncbi:uracil-DNA glycosylase [Rubrivivax albus]|uniref:Type-4 uracil-DNA glycosylase n=1 Tax=Rubrivivax albus TaxID=2499835 RepID=A0A3S2U322_9BURK|nr:uracil-DNA glycosylase [Rubrivivax albus]RVT51595.1 uracil-DNA glycosylase [Rubrivivax albus]
MGWTERQHAMLQAMSLRVWSPVAAPEATAPADPVRLPEPDVDTMPSAPPARRHSPPLRAASDAAVPPPSATPAPLPDAVTDLDWPALREAVAACQACSLCETRRQTVFGVGAERAHWMVVGEAPGEQEDRRGEPFVGPAGQLLDRMLAALGLSRDADGTDPAQQVYIANTLKCRPPGNRNPAPEELARCEPFLMRQIALVQPRIILAMGRFAVQALLRTDAPIGRLRGQVHTYQGVPLVVTYHPAYLLRNLPDKAKAWADLCLAADVLAGSAAEAPARAG